MTIMKCYFAVITKVPDEIDGGNYAVGNLLISLDRKKKDRCIVGAGLYVDPPQTEAMDELMADALCHKKCEDTSKDHMVFCSVPVFELGEIMVMDSRNDRTIPDGRKPDKWHVEYKCFNRIGDAIKCANEVYASYIVKKHEEVKKA